MSRITDYELSHLILRFEQEKNMKVMRCVQNLGALRDLVDLRIEATGLREEVSMLEKSIEDMAKYRDSLLSQLEQAKERERQLQQEKLYWWEETGEANGKVKELESANARLMNALADLVSKIKVMQPRIDAEFAFGRIYGRVYNGPTWGEEMKEADAALQPPKE